MIWLRRAAMAGLCLLAALSWRVAEAAEGQQRFAIVAGMNRGAVREQALQFAQEDAAHVAGVLKGPVGVAADHLILLTGPDISALDRAFAELEDKIGAANRSGQQTLLIVYFSGHSDGKHLQLGDSLYPFTRLKARVRDSAATLKLLIVDSCQSGGLTGLKGMVPTLDVDVWLRQGADARGMVIITSTAAGEFAQESTQLRASYFTHNFIWGLRGAADVNQDGLVSLSEAYNYSYTETVNGTWATIAGRQHPTIEFDLDRRGDVILSRLREQDSMIIFGKQTEGDFAVLEPRTGQLMAQVRKPGGVKQEIAVTAGTYLVSRREGARIMGQRLSLEPGARVRVEPDSMKDMTGVIVARRKQSRGQVRSPISLLVGYSLGAGILGTSVPVHAGHAALRGDLGPLSIFGRLNMGYGRGFGDIPTANELQFQVSSLSLETAVAWRFEVSLLDIFAGLNLGWSTMRQVLRYQNPLSRPVETLGSAVNLGAIGGLDVPIAGGLSANLMWEAGTQLFQREGSRDLSAAPLFRGSLGLGYRF